MLNGSFAKTSWGWEISQWRRQVGEWLEFELSRFETAPRDGGADYSWLQSWLDGTVWVIAVLLVVWLLWLLWRELSHYVYEWLGVRKGKGRGIKSSDTEVSVAGWLMRSQEFYRQGNYRQAFMCLYFGTLQRLHDTNVAPHKRSRTDGEYLQLVEFSLPETQPYETVINTHEQLCFGEVEILPETYTQCQQAYREISKT